MSGQPSPDQKGAEPWSRKPPTRLSFHAGIWEEAPSQAACPEPGGLLALALSCSLAVTWPTGMVCVSCHTQAQPL